ncbi:unnamed protein product [Ceratitis capitata]|uniref:(Mediterranean fruit fly) hypothetical protein n=1 Tax=Ceratitis capitata TaxID=7213 RepID=A0A811U4P5_CERCA|nr:unnamed protein product [Ceratitis capitata]
MLVAHCSHGNQYVVSTHNTKRPCPRAAAHSTANTLRSPHTSQPPPTAGVTQSKVSTASPLCHVAHGQQGS